VIEWLGRHLVASQGKATTRRFLEMSLHPFCSRKLRQLGIQKRRCPGEYAMGQSPAGINVQSR